MSETSRASPGQTGRSHESPVRDQLLHRLRNMVLDPMLRASIPDPDNGRPHFTITPMDQFDLDARLREDRKVDYSDLDLAGVQAKILGLELEHGHRHFNFQSGYLWSVTRYLSAGSSSADNSKKKAFIALSIHHVLSDGVGSTKLAAQLAAPTSPVESEVLWELGPKLEDTISVKLPYLKLATSIWKQRVAIHLPRLSPLQATETPINWPNGRMQPIPTAERTSQVDPRKCETQILVLALSADLVGDLKATSKDGGVDTLHPVLATAFFAACLRQEADTQESVTIRHITPFSLRDQRLGHASATGNYIGIHNLSTTVSQTGSFWQAAEKYASSTRNEANRQQAIERWGEKDWLPAPQKTGMEAVYAAHDPPQFPYAVSVCFSNTVMAAKTHADVPGLDGLVFAQGHHPFGAAICINMVGRPTPDGRAEIQMSWQWKEGACSSGALDNERVQALATIYKRVLDVVANRMDFNKSISFAEVGDLVDQASFPDESAQSSLSLVT